VPIDIPVGLTRTEGTASTIAWAFYDPVLVAVSVAVICGLSGGALSLLQEGQIGGGASGSCAWLFVGPVAARCLRQVPRVAWRRALVRWRRASRLIFITAVHGVVWGARSVRRVFILIANTSWSYGVSGAWG
jgi:hypothetical protein